MAFWFWFVVATAALGRLWSTIDADGQLVRFGPADGVAFLILLVAFFILGRVQYRTARDKAGRS